MLTLDAFSQAWNEALERAKPLTDRLSFKGYRRHAAMSEETTAFTATLTLDGKAVAAVRNHGRGGCTEIMWKDEEIGANLIGDFLQLTEAPPERTILNFEGYISSLAEDHDAKKSWEAFAKRWGAKGWTCFRAEKDGIKSFLRVQDGNTKSDSARRQVEAGGYKIIEIA